jgi:hypothetical protein
VTQAIIQTMWVGGPLTAMAQLSAESFVAHGHDLHIYAYRPVENAPAGATVLDARAILPEARVIRQQSGFGRGSYAPFADLFRYKLLWERGGWWSDADMVCVRPWRFQAPRIVASYWRRKRADTPLNCVLRFPPGDPLMRYCLDRAMAVDLASAEYGEIGPALVERAVDETGAADAVVPWRTFCPIGVRQAQSLVRGWLTLQGYRVAQFLLRRPVSVIDSRSCGVHLWHEMWRQGKLDVGGRYPASSLYERLKAQYLRVPPSEQ